MRRAIFNDQKGDFKNQKEGVIERIQFPWGELVVVGRTNEISVGIDTILPGTETDKEGTYLKRGIAIYYIFEGRGSCGGKPIKKGDLLKIKPGQKINLKNNSKTNLRVITTYMPPYNEANIGRSKNSSK